jgi:hypothetical protein
MIYVACNISVVMLFVDECCAKEANLCLFITELLNLFHNKWYLFFYLFYDSPVIMCVVPHAIASTGSLLL